MSCRTVAAVVLALLTVAALPAPASGGGYSTVGLESAPPSDLRAGQPWEARFELLAHGRTPMTGMEPVVRIERTDGAGGRTFAASETGAPGVYGARVVFPEAGRWAVEVLEFRAPPGEAFAGFGHSFGELEVRPPAGAAATDAGGGLGAPLALALALIAGSLAGGGAWLVQRRPPPRAVHVR